MAIVNSEVVAIARTQGATPLHAYDAGHGMRRVLVPPQPGLLSAMGLLYADVRGDFALTQLMRAEPANLLALNEGLAAECDGGGAVSGWLMHR